MTGPKLGGMELMQLDDTDLKASKPRLEDWLLVRFESPPRVVPLPPRAGADPLADAIDDLDDLDLDGDDTIDNADDWLERVSVDDPRWEGEDGEDGEDES